MTNTHLAKARAALADPGCALSGYDSPLYAELFDGWHRKDLAAPTTLSGDTDRTEVLWSNRPLTRHVQQDLLAEVGA